MFGSKIKFNLFYLFFYEILNQNNKRKQTPLYLVDIKYLSRKEQFKTNAIALFIAEMAVSEWMEEENMVHIHNGVDLAIKKNENPVILKQEYVLGHFNKKGWIWRTSG